jgi:hypothetical protein
MSQVGDSVVGVTDAGWTAVAALGAAALTAVASLGVVAYEDQRRNRRTAQDALRAAVIDLLVRSLNLAARAQAMGEMMKIRSGLGEGLDIVLRHRRPIDLLELHDWVAQDFSPLGQAWAATWLRGDQELIRLANDVVDRAAELIGVSAMRQPAHSAADRLLRWARGERWTKEMLSDHQAALHELADSRKGLAEYARKRLGEDAVNVFTAVDGNSTPVVL